ncbi:paramyosin-like [Platichthys flesus]|uniref:paramyosin-like n=1 Tax=Platichthys flesus TaxID=8260 RepID=UPI002DBCFA48|nr:paramyosin-like [Platichthys flesus]XP_062252335.1 paramyosin-like [Platichthys flesus]XP_062252336.1 paramyosin-like [Platichthys flesus]
MIIKDMRPLSMVEDEGFRAMVKTFQPGYVLPKRTCFTNMMEKKYEHEFLRVKLALSSSRSMSVGHMLSKGTRAFCRAARRVLCCVPAARAREEKLEKENKDLKTKMKVKEEEIFYLSSGQMLSEGTKTICPVVLEKTGLAAENVALAGENATLAPQNVALAAENAALAPENIDLAAEITALTAEKASVTATGAALTAEWRAQARGNIALAAEITTLTAEKVALTAYSTGQVPEIAALIAEATALTAEKIVLVGYNRRLNARNDILKRQQNDFLAALPKEKGAARAALEKQNITLTKKINPSALKLLQDTFILAKTEKAIETARAKEEDLETKLEDLKMTLKVEQEARFKQREDLINQIIETEKLFIEQQEGKLTKQNTELQELALKTDENEAKVKKQRKQEKKEQLEREKNEREELKKTEKKEWIERKKREKKEREEAKERDKLMKREKKEISHAICPELQRTLSAVLLVKPGLAPEIAALSAKSAALAAEKATVAPDKATLAAENAALSIENTALTAENAALAAKNVALAAENTVLSAEKAALVAEIADLTACNVVVAATTAALANERIAQDAEIAALDAQTAALAAEIGAQAPSITFLVPEIAALAAEIPALTAEKAALTGVNSFLERQLDVLVAARSEHNNAEILALTEQNSTLTKEMDYITFKLCCTKFDLTLREKALETARARQKKLEQEIEDVKMTMKVEQEASLKQREDMINQIRETEEKLFIEQRRRHPEQWP